jgi:predicted amidohydrolase YtcJ
MCIVCGPGGVTFPRSIAERYRAGNRSRPRFAAEEIVPETTPPLDPDDGKDLEGPADVILRGGPIVTMRRPGEAVAALALRAGRIQSLGREDEVMPLRGRLTRMIDLDGRAVTPGFINPHWHPPLSLLCDWFDWDGPDSAAKIGVASTSDAGEWLVVRCAPNGDVRTAACVAVERIVNRPSVMVDRDGQVVHANAGAIALHGALMRPSAREGKLVHVSVLLPLLVERLASSREPLRLRLRRTFAELARSGFTTIRFCGLGGIAGEEDVELVRSALDGQGPLRVRGALDIRLTSDAPRSPGFGDDVFRVDAVTAWVREDAAEASDVARRTADLRRRGWRVTLHAEGGGNLRTAIATPADGLECRIGDAREAAALGSGCPLSIGVTGDETPEPDAAEALRSLETSGAFCTLALDRIAGIATPFDILAAAGGRMEFVTTSAARRCGVEAILGALDVGRYADLTFLDADPRKTTATRLRCLSTWVAGREMQPTAATS